MPHCSRGLLYLGLAWTAGNLAKAQLTDLTAPGDGQNLYYAIDRPDASYPPVYISGPIYKIGATPASLYLSFPPPVFPPAPPLTMSPPYYISPYYLVGHPQFSRDGSVFAYTANRVCLGGCIGVILQQTTVEGVPGGPLTFDGEGWLSRNGRFLLTITISLGISQRFFWIDLQTGLNQTLLGGPTYDTPGRVVADDGTAVYEPLGAANGYVFHQGVQTKLPGTPLFNSPAEPAIDASGQNVVYGFLAPATAYRSIHIYHPADKTERLLVQTNADLHSPSISADGTRVMFLSGSASDSQLYTIDIDGTRMLQLSNESAGVQQYTMSDSGQVAWYLAGDSSLVKVGLTPSGISISRFHVPAIDLSSTIVPGSAVTLQRFGLTEIGSVQVLLNDVSTPLLSASPISVVFQAPWETPVGQAVNLEVITGAGTNDEAHVQAAVIPVDSFPSLVSLVGYGGTPIHQDWSDLVNYSHPALPGEILYFFGTGFGAVQSTPATGVPAPDVPVPIVAPLSCNLPVLYAGLAPGLIGYYQIAIQLPPTLNWPYGPYTPLCYFTCSSTVVASINIAPNSFNSSGGLPCPAPTSVAPASY